MTPEAIKAVREALAPFAALANRKPESPTDTGKYSLVPVSDLLAAEDALALLAAEQAKAPPDRERLARLRVDGWTVAVHNDYRQDGEARTFWLLTHPNGRWIKGEGLTDEDALAECEAAALRLSLTAGGEWQPIETAPKDGTRILLGGPSGYLAPHDWHAESGHWERRSQQFPGPVCWRSDSGDAYTDGWSNPTHWMPLQPSPKEAGR